MTVDDNEEKKKERLLQENISRSDPKRVYELYEAWPKLAEQALETRVDVPQKRYDRLIYLAIGGSATAGDIISDWFLSSGGIEVSVFRGSLPKMELENTLVIVCSTSGDTVETLRMAETVRRRHPDVVTLSHGGRLKEMAEREGIVHVQIALSKAPRFSLPSSLFASIGILRSASLLEGMEWELDDAISTMKGLAVRIGIHVGPDGNSAKQVAEAIQDKLPCVYTSSVTRGVARRFKNSLNENAKVHASFDSAPDFFHNEVEAWGRSDPRQHPIVLRRDKEPLFEATALDNFTALLESRGVHATRVDSMGEGNLSQLMSLCYTLDYASYYLAILNGVEPFEIALIDELKKKSR